MNDAQKMYFFSIKAAYRAPKGELFDVLNKSVTVSEKKARRLMRQLFDGVAFMHDRNIVHRDLKVTFPASVEHNIGQSLSISH